MSRYKVTVFERTVQEYEYEVEADSVEEAKQNALDGLRVNHQSASNTS